MAAFIPITLAGDTLGQRQRNLNSIVTTAHHQGLPFSAFQTLQEHSAVDRLFKIDLASKQRNLEYILLNLKDEDMLYVSRALKSTWLLEEEYRHIINPIYLEETLYPDMKTTAVNKMRHWIHLNLRDTSRCEEFFEYYFNKNFDLAMKFLWHCSKDAILLKTNGILEKMTPNYLKMLCQTCPEIVKKFFDSFLVDEAAVTNYYYKERDYYNSIKCLLKLNADIFLDIMEKYYNKTSFPCFSSEATKYIMMNHKTRFNNKPELYTAWLLDVNTLANYLSEEEIKQTVRTLAKAKYLGSYFSYKKVEPLIKKLDVKTRAAFKKEIFVHKFVDLVEDWPYKPPARPQLKPKEMDIFQDTEYSPNSYQYLDAPPGRAMGFVSGYCTRSAKLCKRSMLYSAPCIKTYLDQLFDKYRFDSFEKTLGELRLKMSVENLRNRQDIMLVLVSKTGGRSDHVAELLNLLISRHKNEPDNLRATVIRSFVKRSAVWRLNQETWNVLLQFSQGLGLDGGPSPVPCNEGLHAVVLRSILLDQQCSDVVKKAFFENFNTLREYDLTVRERDIVSKKLPALLLTEAESNPKEAFIRLSQLLDTLEAFKIRPDQRVIQAITNIVKRDLETRPLLYRLFNDRIGRKELFKENFEIIQTNASYYNALKHNTNVLKSGNEFEVLAKSGTIRHDSFLRALFLYFGEHNGLAEKYLSILEKRIENAPDKKLGRPIALLIGTKLISKLQSLDGSPKKSEANRFAAALRANAHLARPIMDINDVNWQWMGSKAIANRILTCSDKTVDAVIQKLLNSQTKQKLALVLSIRAGKEMSVLHVVAANKPKLALKTILRHIKKKTLNEAIWDFVLQLLVRIKRSKIDEKRFIALVSDANIVKRVPSDKKAEYFIHVYDILIKVSRDSALPMLCNVENILSEVDSQFIERVYKEFLDNDFTKDNILNKNRIIGGFHVKMSLYLRVFAKYILLTENVEIQKNRLEAIVNPVFDRFEDIWKEPKSHSILLPYIKQFINALKYNKVFLNTKYITCIPVFEHILNRLHKILPVNLHCEIYIRLHLTMLFFKSVRQSIQNNPDVFKEIKKNVNQAVEIVALIFGKYIAREFEELQSKYFESIVVLYNIELLSYIVDSFQRSHMKNNLFIASIIKGILMSENNGTHLLAALTYKNHKSCMDSNVSDDVFEALKLSKSQEIPFFLQIHS